MKSVKFTFIFDSEKEAKIIAESLKPEINNKIPKTNVDATLSGCKFILKIETEDLSSLRAASNSYLRWIGTALNVNKTV
jgi:tRNA threonylcarbamoyladenosine modification (KEOPS) complex  Pcc1 subunit